MNEISENNTHIPHGDFGVIWGKEFECFTGDF